MAISAAGRVVDSAHAREKQVEVRLRDLPQRSRADR
jgi:hypothetical protein